MKFLFVTGSLEPGKDGVGDYTRALAGELARSGHESFLLSLNDSWLRGSATDAKEMRLGAQMSWPDRINAAKKFLALAQADWLSLQFVPYSFHPAGLNFALPQILSSIAGRIPLHCMFHEIWIGAEKGAPAKVRLFGYCQRKTIQSLVRKLNCRVAHTSNTVYTRLLARAGIKASRLPLFGSIPIAKVSSPASGNHDALKLGLFGSVHPEWDPAEMLEKLQTLRRPIRLAHIGRIGPGSAVWERVVRESSSAVETASLGEKPGEEVSRFLSSLDFGVATTPLALIGKSSCTAAMLDHGLPVIVPRDDVHYQGISPESDLSDRLIPLDQRFIDRVKSTGKIPARPRLPEVATQFLADLGSSE